MLLTEDKLQALIDKEYNEALNLEAKLRLLFQKTKSVVDVIKECQPVDSNVLLTMVGGMKATPQEIVGETVLTCAEYELVNRGELSTENTSIHYSEHFPSE